MYKKPRLRSSRASANLDVCVYIYIYIYVHMFIICTYLLMYCSIALLVHVFVSVVVDDAYLRYFEHSKQTHICKHMFVTYMHTSLSAHTHTHTHSERAFQVSSKSHRLCSSLSSSLSLALSFSLGSYASLSTPVILRGCVTTARR